jgi:glycerophosphoryl diester phosphodiesterase
MTHTITITHYFPSCIFLYFILNYIEFVIHSVTLYLPSGERPLVIARGGFSGLFPESSADANSMAIAMSLPDVVLLCNLQLSKDGIGVCTSDIRLNNSTNVQLIYPDAKKTYTVNGKEETGWFSLDYTIDELLNNLTCKS